MPSIYPTPTFHPWSRLPTELKVLAAYADDFKYHALFYEFLVPIRKTMGSELVALVRIVFRTMMKSAICNTGLLSVNPRELLRDMRM